MKNRRTDLYHHHFEFALIGPVDAEDAISNILEIYTGLTIEQIDVLKQKKYIPVSEGNYKLKIEVTPTLYNSDETVGEYSNPHDAIIMVFDMAKEASLYEAIRLIREIKARDINKKNPPIILVGDHSKERTQLSESAQKALNRFCQQNNIAFREVYTHHSKINPLVKNVFHEATTSALTKLQNQTDRAKLISALQAYLADIDSHKTIDGKTNFAHGFRLFAKSRGLNRRANYLLAKELLVKLAKNDNLSIENIFSNFSLEVTRSHFINTRFLNKDPSYKKRGINSKRLNDIIKFAKHSPDKLLIPSKDKKSKGKTNTK